MDNIWIPRPGLNTKKVERDDAVLCFSKPTGSSYVCPTDSEIFTDPIPEKRVSFKHDEKTQDYSSANMIKGDIPITCYSKPIVTEIKPVVTETEPNVLGTTAQCLRDSALQQIAMAARLDAIKALI
jgi:hypothetical protein